jgi:putative oxidoreductase
MKKLFSTKYSDNVMTFALFVLRLSAGGLMIPHGYQKLMKFDSLSSTFADPFHFGHTISLILVIFAEFFCAAFIVLGLFTRLACIPLITTTSVAIVHAHKGNIFGKGELLALFLGSFITLLFAGPGKFSVDKLIGK